MCRHFSDRAMTRIAVSIDPKHLESLWFENEEGDKFFIDWENWEGLSADEGYDYMFSRNPDVLVERMHVRNEDGNWEELCVGESSFPEDLVLAIVESGDYGLCDSITIASICCERCMNALAHQYGLDWGYPEFGEEWRDCSTSCQFCEDEKSFRSEK